MMDVEGFQGEFAEWHKRNWPGETRELAGLGLAEEAGELCRALLKRAQGIRGSAEEWDAEIRKEIGDVFLSLVWIANLCGVDFEEAVADRWDTIRKRNWVTDPLGHGLPES